MWCGSLCVATMESFFFFFLRFWDAFVLFFFFMFQELIYVTKIIAGPCSMASIAPSSETPSKQPLCVRYSSPQESPSAVSCSLMTVWAHIRDCLRTGCYDGLEGATGLPFPGKSAIQITEMRELVCGSDVWVGGQAGRVPRVLQVSTRVSRPCSFPLLAIRAVDHGESGHPMTGAARSQAPRFPVSTGCHGPTEEHSSQNPLPSAPAPGGKHDGGTVTLIKASCPSRHNLKGVCLHVPCFRNKTSAH